MLYRIFTNFANFVFAIIETLLSLRFIFRLFAANSHAPFVDWLYRTSDVLVSPFRGIFQEAVFDGRFVFDVTALVSLVLYSVAFSLVIYLFRVLLLPPDR